MMKSVNHNIQEQERKLLDEWEVHWRKQHGKYLFFNRDGIVNYSEWEKLPESKKVLFVLKETNGLQGSLAEFLYHRGSGTYYRTWNNVARWTEMILNNHYVEHVSNDCLGEILQKIAAVNLKKYAGGPVSDRQEIIRIAKADCDLLKRQIRLYRADIIIACGFGLTADILHDEIFNDTAIWNRPDNEKNAGEKPNLWYYRSDIINQGKETLVISMPHPNRSARTWTLELQKLLYGTVTDR